MGEILGYLYIPCRDVDVKNEKPRSYASFYYRMHNLNGYLMSLLKSQFNGRFFNAYE